jgi:phenylacetate-CoA ligase
MNPLYDPIFLLKIIKSYLFDIDRLKKFDEKRLRIYQDRTFKRLLKYAYEVPLYRELYIKNGVDIRDIDGIDEINKLPFITKEIIKKYYPEGIIPFNVSKDRLIKISTSGTTGKSLSIYSDIFDVFLWFFIYIRILREYDINWRRNRLSIIADFSPNTIGSGYVKKSLFKIFNNNIFFRNIQWLDTNDRPDYLIKEINKFNPDFIGGYPGMLGHLALLKEKGFGINVNPDCIATIGSVLDKSLKKYIHDIFNSAVFEVYGATESGTIAYECKRGNMHVMSDLLYVEFLKNNNPVDSMESGRLVVTKLYGGGTPIIRYNAINDIVAPLYEKCSCGIKGDLIHKIYGREDLSLILPDGKAMLASSFSEIFSKVIYELKSTKLLDTKVIQHNLNNIEIQIKLDQNLKNNPPSNYEIIKLLKDGFVKKMGNNVEINIREVNKIEGKSPRIVTKVDKSKLIVNSYI